MFTITRRQAFGLVAAASMLSALPAVAEEQPFVTADSVNLVDLLPSPPGEAESKAELAAFHAYEPTRTKEAADRAVADDEETVFRFLAGMDIQLDPAKVPLTAKFFERVAATEGAVVDPAKKVWNRPRPPKADPTIKPLVELSKSGSYPSGHATLGLLFGVTLAKIVPEKKDEFFARAFDYGHSRYVVGIHYLSDLEASKMAGAATGNAMLQNADFQKEMEPVKAELRAALGLK